MDFYVAHRTILASLQIFHNAAFADCGAERKFQSHSRQKEVCIGDKQAGNSHVCRHSVIVVASMK